MSVDDNQEVSLRIGANCVRALETREVISSQNGGPYALKTLGPMINQTKAASLVVIESCWHRLTQSSLDVITLLCQLK